MREIVLDTETTGLDPNTGDRVVEIGCLELINHLPTGHSYQTYINPERPMSAGASDVSGITDAMLADKPGFADIASNFLEFLGDAPLVIHNAAFDLKFLNSEFNRLSLPQLEMARAIDTLQIARRKFPRAPVSLDALCRRFEIDLSVREKHGALIDAELLARVYLELIGGRQPSLVLAETDQDKSQSAPGHSAPARLRERPLANRLSKDMLDAHSAFIEAELGPDALWKSLLPDA